MIAELATSRCNEKLPAGLVRGHFASYHPAVSSSSLFHTIQQLAITLEVLRLLSFGLVGNPFEPLEMVLYCLHLHTSDRACVVENLSSWNGLQPALHRGAVADADTATERRGRH